MRIFFSGLFLGFIFSSCSLNANQEKSLNKSIVKYLFSVNRELKLSIAASTHPLILRQLKEDGDEKLKTYLYAKNFSWSDAIIGRTKIKNEIIHIELKIAQTNKSTYEKEEKRIRLYAISEDDGKNWYFLEYKLYESNYCKKLTRLLKW